MRQLILYGLKGISAYGHQARELGYYSDQVDDFYIQALEAITDDSLTVDGGSGAAGDIGGIWASCHIKLC